MEKGKLIIIGTGNISPHYFREIKTDLDLAIANLRLSDEQREAILALHIEAEKLTSFLQEIYRAQTVELPDFSELAAQLKLLPSADKSVYHRQNDKPRKSGKRGFNSARNRVIT